MRWRRRKSPDVTSPDVPIRREPQAEVTAASSPTVEFAQVSDPALSIVIVTYGKPEVVAGCLESLAAHTDVADVSYEVIVVDNADQEAGEQQPTAVTAWLRAHTAGLTLVPSPTNTGFGGGNNLGVAAARAPIVCLCNPDIRVPSAWPRPLLAALDDPRVGVAAPVLVNADGSPQEFGQVLLDNGFTLAVGGPELFPGDWSQAVPRVVDYASAAFWVTRRDLYLRLGGFDDRFHPAYWEDVDFALRMEALGAVTRLVPDVHVVHEKGGSADASLALAQRSHARFVERWTDRLRQQPAHPHTDADRVAARDTAARRLDTA